MIRFALPGAFAGILMLAAGAFAAEKTEPAPAETPAAKTNSVAAQDSPQALRAYLQLQEQVHSALLAIESARKDAEASARRNSDAIEFSRQEAETASRRHAETVAVRLKLIEETLTTQRETELEVIAKSNRMLVTIVAVAGGCGLLVILLAAFFLWRAMGRVTELAMALQPLYTSSRHSDIPLHAADAPFVTLNGPEMSNTRLLGAIEKLERRILELETTASLPNAPGAHSSDLTTGDADGARALIEKGQASLDAQEPQEAIEAFDGALAIDPGNAEALVKKGTALEQLKRLEDAIECYDRAIAANQALTVAYLHKGAVYNQLERFSEALECYEQALRTQQKPVNS